MKHGALRCVGVGPGRDLSRAKRPIEGLLLLTLTTLFAIDACTPTPAEQVTINRQATLSPGHYVAGYSITRTPGGEFIVVGGTTLMNHTAWAARLDSSGKTKWEYLDGPSSSWTDYSTSDNQFFGAVELANNTTLLCGVKKVGPRHVSFLLRIDESGNRIDERFPAVRGISLRRCLRWDTGVAILGRGFLERLDSEGNLLWDKYDDSYAAQDAVESPDHGLFLISFSGDATQIVRLDRDGAVIARHTVSGSEQRLMHPLSWSQHIFVGTMKSTFESEFFEFDLNLNQLGHMSARNVGIKSGLELKDSSLVVFGSQYQNTATANVTRIYKNHQSANFPLQPLYSSPWYVDAVPGEAPGQFVTLRIVQGSTVVAWISIN